MPNTSLSELFTVEEAMDFQEALVSSETAVPKEVLAKILERRGGDWSSEVFFYLSQDDAPAPKGARFLKVRDQPGALLTLSAQTTRRNASGYVLLSDNLLPPIVFRR